ncbi:MAG: hypothetical protein LBU36_03050 [Clostridiales bacterium]|jgi:hypothetical protein|nr:hypothetical protein [Clostridiales bacterium]
MSKSVTGNIQKKQTKAGVRYYPYINAKIGDKNKPEYLGCSFTTKKEALRKLSEEITLRNSQPDNMEHSGNVLFSDWVARWLEDKAAQNKIKTTSLKSYRETAKTHVIPYFADKKLKLSAVGWSEIEK